MINISEQLDTNISCFKDLFKNSMDFIVREFCINNTDAAILAIDGLVNKEQIAISILNPLLQTPVAKSNGEEIMCYV